MSEVTSNFPSVTSSHPLTQSTSSYSSISSTQTISTITSSIVLVVSSTSIPPTYRSTSVSSQNSNPIMANQPWMNPGVVLIANPNPLPDHLEKWLPKYNLDDGLPDEEHINNFMLAMNLNGVAHEDIVARLFPYTLQGYAISWYFSLPAGSIADWETFE